MAQVTIALGMASAPGDYGSPSVMSCAAEVDYFANPTTSTQTAVTGDGRKCVQITATGGAIWVRFGANPTAAADTAQNHVIIAETTRDFGPLPDGWKVAVINDS